MHDSLGVFKMQTTKWDSTEFITYKFVFLSSDSFKM